ncbi:hypothetical protein LOK49_LG12G01955 [Camellia lanceoleosa]|uniref:Uncharacterized protein n=1 Tax=Camellia lanceoleosa TaxID=1840588 RepID=A0ACC0FUT7_9ERIC|nr:hypothetical protein LOK49_LG12G01955 [Camellia lanceoleosa]
MTSAIKGLIVVHVTTTAETKKETSVSRRSIRIHLGRDVIVQEQGYGWNKEWESGGSRPSMRPHKEQGYGRNEEWESGGSRPSMRPHKGLIVVALCHNDDRDEERNSESREDRSRSTWAEVVSGEQDNDEPRDMVTIGISGIERNRVMAGIRSGNLVDRGLQCDLIRNRVMAGMRSGNRWIAPSMRPHKCSSTPPPPPLPHQQQQPPTLSTSPQQYDAVL